MTGFIGMVTHSRCWAFVVTTIHMSDLRQVGSGGDAQVPHRNSQDGACMLFLALIGHYTHMHADPARARNLAIALGCRQGVAGASWHLVRDMVFLPSQLGRMAGQGVAR